LVMMLLGFQANFKARPLHAVATLSRGKLNNLLLDGKNVQ